jgi:hypothetical protein
MLYLLSMMHTDCSAQAQTAHGIEASNVGGSIAGGLHVARNAHACILSAYTSTDEVRRSKLARLMASI